MRCAIALKARNSIQSGEYSMDGGVDGASHEKRVVAVNMNWNADNREWNFNANDLDDDNWDDENCVFSRSLPVLPRLCPGKFL